MKVNLKRMKLLKCKVLINKILCNVKRKIVTMFVIFSLVRKIIKLRFFKFKFKFSRIFKNNNQLINNIRFVRTSILRTKIF